MAIVQTIAGVPGQTQLGPEAPVPTAYDAPASLAGVVAGALLAGTEQGREFVYVISVNGTDISRTLNPLLISLTLHLYQSGAANCLEIELDDSNGQLAIPPMGASISASIGWNDGSGVAAVFEGTVSDASAGGAGTILSTGSRSKGRVLQIISMSIDVNGPVKTTQEAHADDKTFQQVAAQWGAVAGLAVKVDEAIGSTMRPYWSIANESFLAWGTRIAQELGASFQIMGNVASFVGLNSPLSPSGSSLTGVRAVWGDNLIAWSITPILGRPGYASFKSRFYSMVDSTWNVINQPGLGNFIQSTAELVDRFKAASQGNAQNVASANAAAAQGAQGLADWVIIDGAPEAQPQSQCTVSGIRDGVDGTFTVYSVMHRATRRQGFTTELQLSNPSGTAGAQQPPSAQTPATFGPE